MVQMNDGRYLVAREKEITKFFYDNHLIGRKITGIFPTAMNYGIGNLDDILEEIEDISAHTCQCSIQTDDFVLIEVENCGCLEIQFSGSGGPIILNMIRGEYTYPHIPDDLFPLNTMFHDCIGKKITDIIVDRNSNKMLFPRFCGIDMSSEDEGVWRIRFVLEDGSCLAFFGSVDWSCVEYLDKQGEIATVPMLWLLPNSICHEKKNDNSVITQKGTTDMVLLKDEYTEMENSFLELYSDEIKRIVYAEKKVYMDERMKDMKLTEFIKRYMGSVAFILIILFFAWVKDVVSIHILVGFAILEFIAFLPAYEAWKKDMKLAAIESYSNMVHQIIADFVYEKMREVVLNSRIGIDFEKNVQFYSIALHEIPRNFYVNVYNDSAK